MHTPDQDFREAVKERYRFSEWAGRVEGEEGVTRRDVRLPDDLVEAWSVERTHDLSEMVEGPAARYVYARTGDDGRERVMVKLYEHGSVLEAHEALIDLLMSSMAPSLPPCAEVGIRAGDVCFGSHGEVRTGVMFARHNVLVHVQSIGARAVSVAPFAAAIDELLR